MALCQIIWSIEYITIVHVHLLFFMFDLNSLVFIISQSPPAVIEDTRVEARNI